VWLIQFVPDTICAPIQFVTGYNLCPIQFVPDTVCSRYNLFPIQFVPIQFVLIQIVPIQFVPIQFVHEPEIRPPVYTLWWRKGPRGRRASQRG
jgi:hypothetical protein